MTETNESKPGESTTASEGTSRRRVLTVLAATPTILAGCALSSTELPDGNQDPDYDGGGDDASTPEDTGGGGTDTGGGGTDTGGGGTDTGTACGTGVNVGAATSFVVGQWKKVTVGTSRFNVGRDASGLWAYSNTCTHNNSCQLNNPNSTTGAMTCPCHGAAFDGNGKVTKGPAVSALKNYKVTVCNGSVFVDKATTVASGTRTPVP
jgi:nitrite reductase/ring-hydroxylating ferredoxin subunit